MKSFLIVCLSTAFALSAGSAIAETSAFGASGAQQAAGNVESERKVCTREKKLGSNRVERVCRTRAELAREKETARDQVEGWNHCSGNQSLCGGRQTN